MANTWLRLWHDMPNDPKWRTIARTSKQPISLVLSVYLHLLVDASQNVTRGHVSVTIEDLASALDCDENQVSDILKAMEGRVLDEMFVTGWDKRQPKREDSGSPESGALSAAERKRRQRAREEEEKSVTQSHAESQSVTTDKDKDADKEPLKPIARNSSVRFNEFWEAWPKSPRKVDKAKCEKKWVSQKLDRIADQIIQHVIAIKQTKQWLVDGFEPSPMTYLNGGRWSDEIYTGEGAAQSNTKPWYISGTGIESKAKELGIELLKDEIFPAFKVRVYKAAGITHDMVRTATEEFSQRKVA